MIKLSFCIPVYNFADFIGETLESVFSALQGFQEYEVVVLDGGSTDHTAEVMAGYLSDNPKLRYICLPERGGIDADMHRCVEEARGEYCWLLSGDDTIDVGSVNSLLGHFEQNCDVYLCEHVQCDLDLKFLYEYPIFESRVKKVVDLAVPEVRERYLAAARNTEAIFSFMSGIIVRRAIWLSADPPEVFRGSCWWHVARLLEHVRDKLEVCFVGESWVYRRGGNDSFLDRGLVRRLGISVDGYQDLADYYFGSNSIEARQVRRLIRADLKSRYFLYAKLMTHEDPDTENRSELDRLVSRAYSDRSLSCILSKSIYFLMPSITLRATRTIWRESKALLSGSGRKDP